MDYLVLFEPNNNQFADDVDFHNIINNCNLSIVVIKYAWTLYMYNLWGFYITKT